MRIEKDLTTQHPDTSESLSLTAVSPIKSLVFATNEQIHSRRIISRSRTRGTGKYPSWKMGRSLHWESIYENYAFRLLDCDPSVRWFAEQPCQIEYESNGVIRRHFPDILVEISDRKELWEVKTNEDAESAEVASRTSLLQSELPVFGYYYRLVLADELAAQPRLSNALLLLSWGRRQIPELCREPARRFFRREGSVTWADVCAGVLGKWGRRTVCRLVLEGALSVDMHSEIGPETVFRVRKGWL